MKDIVPRQITTSCVTIPGSKSISHRMVICAALSSGTCLVSNVLESQDVMLTINALRQMGAGIEKKNENTYEIQGFNGFPQKSLDPVYLGNSGTSMRLLAGIAALGNTEFVLTGDERMCQRPMDELLAALKKIGIIAFSRNAAGTPPIIIQGKSRLGGQTFLDCSKSSQYLSALLLMGGLLDNGLEITLASRPVSMPYIGLTCDIMAQFGVTTRKKSDTLYHVPGRQTFEPGHYHVEPDLSNAGYFWAAGAICRQPVYVKHISKKSLQGDLALIDHFEKMGCVLYHSSDGIGVKGGDLEGIEVDMSDTPDAVPALAVVAAFAKGRTCIYNIAHLREKECDRIDAIVTELNKTGIKATQGDDYMIIHGGRPKGARIETYNDHRIAMAFSIMGLVIPGIEIENPGCVAKSFPNFWDVLNTLNDRAA